MGNEGPTDRDRRALWWLNQHPVAERAVTIASASLDAAANTRERELWSDLLDARLDHLEVVEDACDAIIARLRENGPRWVADAVAAHWMEGRTAEDAAEAVCKSGRYVSREMYRALRRLDDSR